MNKSEINYRLFGFLYFPIQYLFIHVLYFGFNLEPNILQVYSAFGVTDILIAVFKFVAIIPFKVFTAEKLIYFIFYLIPYAFKIILSTWRIWLFIFAIKQLITFILANISVLLRKINDNVSVVIKIGAPGSGKSSSAGYDAIKLANKMWRNLQYDYWRYSAKIDKWRKQNNIEKLQQWYEIRDAYEFYMSNDCIPCLWANIPIKDLHDSKANELTYEHLYQEKRLPAFSVLYIDEIGGVLDVDLYKDKPLQASNFFRYCRHFGRFIIIGTEQSAENVYIDVRRVVSYHEYMLSQTWVCRPWMLIIFYSIFKFLFPKIPKSAKVFAGFMTEFNNLIRHVGYRKYNYCYEGNTEREQSMFSNRKRTYYLPSPLNYFYDDRTYRNYYLAKDMPLEARIYGSLILQEESDLGIRYLRQQEAEQALEAQAEAQIEALVDKVVNSKQLQMKAQPFIDKYKKRKELLKALDDSEELREEIEAL